MTALTTIYYPPFPKPVCEGNMKNISLQIYTPNLKKASVCSTHCWCTISAQTEPPIPGSMFLLVVLVAALVAAIVVVFAQVAIVVQLQQQQQQQPRRRRRQ